MQHWWISGHLKSTWGLSFVRFNPSPQSHAWPGQSYSWRGKSPVYNMTLICSTVPHWVCWSSSDTSSRSYSWPPSPATPAPSYCQADPTWQLCSLDLKILIFFLQGSTFENCILETLLVTIELVLTSFRKIYTLELSISISSDLRDFGKELPSHIFVCIWSIFKKY